MCRCTISGPRNLADRIDQQTPCPAPVCADSHTRRTSPELAGLDARRLADEIGLVEHFDLRQRARADFAQHAVDLRNALAAIRVGRIDDVQQQGRLARFLQRRAERSDQLVRQVAHEPDGVGEQREPRIGQLEPAHGRIERREQLIGGVRAGARQRG